MTLTAQALQEAREYRAQALGDAAYESFGVAQARTAFGASASRDDGVAHEGRPNQLELTSQSVPPPPTHGTLGGCWPSPLCWLLEASLANPSSPRRPIIRLIAGNVGQSYFDRQRMGWNPASGSVNNVFFRRR